MNHAVTILAYGNLELTKQTLNSVLQQDIPCDIYVIDNGSRDGTWEWLTGIPKSVIWSSDKSSGEHRIFPRRNEHNLPPIMVGNQMLAELFRRGHEYVLGLANDVSIPSNFYRLILDWPRGMVTASPTDNPEFPRFEKATAISECTPMSAALIRKWMYDAMMARFGYFFDERFGHYASDCDLAVRMGALGIRGVQLDVQYHHVGSATLKNSPPEARREAEIQADRDRAFFVRKYGFAVDAWEYGQFTSDLQNRGQNLIDG